MSVSGRGLDAAAVDGELGAFLQQGERKAAAALLVRAYAADVYALCRALVRDPTSAEDLSQEVFSRAIHGLAEFRGEASARSWLLRIARNLCFDHLTRLRRQPWDPEEAEPDADVHADDAPPVWELLSRREDAERALGALRENERAIVVLHFGHGVGYPELAAAFNLREGAVRMRVSRALSRMREALVEETALGFEAHEEAMPLASEPERAGRAERARKSGAPSAAPPPPPAPAAARPFSLPAALARLAKRAGAPPSAAPPAASGSMPLPVPGSSSGAAPMQAVATVGALHVEAPAALLARLERLAAAA